ncbi:MAG: hypothetical protein K9N07_10235 [Candidatus Cloacimonetes bacterium]|nr:hypothetical protein [Candidatus Cloacimonadota bacterium]
MIEKILTCFSKEFEANQLYIKESNTLLNTAGVYVLVRKEKIPVNRMLATDNERIMYIGKTGNKNGLRDRLRHFFNCATNSKNKDEYCDVPVEGHSGGRRYFLNLKKKLGLAKEVLNYMYIACDDNEKAEILESKLLNQYVDKFGEVPPLNSQLPQK